MTLRGPRAIPAISTWENCFSSEPSSKVLTTTAFFPAKRPARTITTFPLSVGEGDECVSVYCIVMQMYFVVVLVLRVMRL